MKIITLLICILPMLGYSQAWTDKMYQKYTYKSFENYAPANKSIDFKQIDYKLLDAAIFYETNRQRAKKGRKRFKHSVGLEKAAQRYSQDMVEKKFFSHSGKVRGRKTLNQRLKYAGVNKYFSAAENIAMTSETQTNYLNLAKALLIIWMNSPGHRRNILDKSNFYIGCGAYFNKSDYVYSTQIFSDLKAQNDTDYENPKLK